MSNFFEHMQDGISQLERQLEALAPDYVKVDERSPQELLQLLTHLASQFNYYDFQNRINGTWEEFFHADLVVMLITAGALDFTPYESAFLRIREDLQYATGDDTLFEHTRELFLLLYKIGVVLMDTLRKLQQADKSYRIWSYVQQVIEMLEDDMIRLHRFEYQVINLFPRQVALHGNRLRPLELTHTLRQLYNRAFENPGEGTEIFEGFFSLNTMYDTLRAKFYQVTSAAPYYLKNELKDMQHSPHMGLIMTFIQLYGHLQDLINQLPKRHLDFYYRQVLGLQSLKATPDKVHIFLEAAPSAHTFTIEKGRELMAVTPTRKEPLLYILLDHVKVHNVKIMSFHTLFVSDYLQISAPPGGGKDIREAQAYLAVHPVVPAADYEKESTVIEPWPVLGEDQHDLSASSRTMIDPDMGFIIGSPTMYLHEGNRHLHIKLYFEPNTYNDFVAYVKNFAQVSNRNEAVVLTQLLSGAFHLYYTAEKGWEPIDSFSVSCRIDGPLDNCIDISFALDVTDKSWTNYDSKVHGDGLNSRLPLLKVLLNNASFHHPYSFLRQLLLKRVHVNVKVIGHKYFKLHNSAGPLSAEQSFLPFGPQPYVGSYLDISNSNIFNRFTRDFSIQLDWLNLPRDINGFNSYYQAYEAGLDNDSFKVGISALNSGRYFPERGKQQLMPVFHTVMDKEGNSYLSDTTILLNMDFHKLSFTNDMLMKDEWEGDVSIYREGGIRLELASPVDAFGHRLFTQVFPEVVMYNAQKGWLPLPKKKKAVPNMPYTPMLQSISVNYTLEHMEALRSVQTDEDGDGLEVYHAMPSGNRKIYPVAGNNTFSLLPVAVDMANLSIGFDQLYPNEELSLLFQMEEKQYSDAVGSATPVKWSYLDNNRWVPFERTQLLSDDTNNLQKSGIVKLRIPPGIRNGNTMLDSSLYWIRVSAETAVGASPRVVGIFPNAVVAERVVTDDGQSLDEILSIAPFSIKKFKADHKSIQHVWQPFASFGGRGRETETQYYTRVSERLRHKNRPMLGADLAQVLLQAFPELLIVKSLCIDDSRLRHMPEQPDVSIVVVPAPAKANSGQFTTLEPKVDLATLYRIQAFVQRSIPPFVKAEIRNPVYEKVKVVCKVRFNGDEDNDNLYLQKMHDDIKQYLCPWLFDADHNFKIGSVLYTSEMLNFINRLPYVEFVTAFSLVHFFTEKDPRSGLVRSRATDTAVDEVAFIAASVPEGVLIPVHEHLITVMDMPAYEQAKALGIDGLQLSSELLVGKDGSGMSSMTTAEHVDDERITISIQPK